MSCQKELFSSYSPCNSEMLKMGNKCELEVFGISIVCLKTNNNSRLVHNSIKHDPDVRLNIFSAGKLDDEDYYSTFGDG